MIKDNKYTLEYTTDKFKSIKLKIIKRKRRRIERLNKQ